jgi:hypothetical protein
MKRFLATALLSIGTLALLSSGPSKCNQALMESYDLDGQPKTVADTNVFCPAITQNCCGLSAQLNIYKKLVIKGERQKIADFYEKFSRVFQLIFTQFAIIESLAETVASATEHVVGSNCNIYAKVILRNKISEMGEAVLVQVKRTFNFLLKSRQGFYCTLCDAESHPFFNKTAGTFAMDYGFCSSLVDNTMNFLLFRYKFFVKVARLYSQFLMNCDLQGRFHPDLVVSNEIKFFRKEKILSALEICQKGFGRPGAMTACEDFCRHFNPVHYDPMFEGEIDRLFALEGFLKRRVRILKKRHQFALARQSEDDSRPKRVLEEIRSTPENENEINSFNREFKTVLAIHHSYRFKYDTTIKYHTSFDESLFEAGVERFFDLTEYRPEVRLQGIDFFSAGDVTIDREGAMRAFEMLNPEKKGEFDFDSFLKK